MVECMCGGLPARCPTTSGTGSMAGIFVCACILASFPCPRLDDPTTLQPASTTAQPPRTDGANEDEVRELWLHVDMDAFFLSAAVAAARGRWHARDQTETYVHAGSVSEAMCDASGSGATPLAASTVTRLSGEELAAISPAAIASHTTMASQTAAPSTAAPSTAAGAWSYAGYSPGWHDWLPLRPLLVAHGTGRGEDRPRKEEQLGDLHEPRWVAVVDTRGDAGHGGLLRLAKQRPNDVLSGACLRHIPRTAAAAAPKTLPLPALPAAPQSSADADAAVLAVALATATEQSANSTSSVSSSNALARYVNSACMRRVTFHT